MQDSLFEFNTAISGFFIQLKLMWLVDQPKGVVLTSVLPETSKWFKSEVPCM